MNTHYKKQKMPFSHFRHPKHQSQFENKPDFEGRRPGGAKSQPKQAETLRRKLLRELEAGSTEKVRVQDPNLHLSLVVDKNGTKQYQSPLNTLSMSNELQIIGVEKKSSNILPAPQFSSLAISNSI